MSCNKIEGIVFLAPSNFNYDRMFFTKSFSILAEMLQHVHVVLVTFIVLTSDTF